MHGEAAEATPTQPKRTTSVSSASGSAAGGGARRRPAHDLCTPASRSARGCNLFVHSLHLHCISTASPLHRRSISAASPPCLHVAAGGGEREAREAGAPAAETSRTRLGLGLGLGLGLDPNPNPNPSPNPNPYPNQGAARGGDATQGGARAAGHGATSHHDRCGAGGGGAAGLPRDRRLPRGHR